MTRVMSLTAVSSRRCQLDLCYRYVYCGSVSLVSVSIAVSVSFLGFSMINSVTGLVGVIVCFSIVDF